MNLPAKRVFQLELAISPRREAGNASSIIPCTLSGWNLYTMGSSGLAPFLAAGGGAAAAALFAAGAAFLGGPPPS